MIVKARLITGVVLFVFVLGHLINHALGVHSLAAMEAGRSGSPLPGATRLGQLHLPDHY